MSPPPIAFSTNSAATVALVAIVLSGLLILALHVVRPDLEPSWRMLSEYANGRHGWMMKAAFWLMAIGNLALAYALYARAGTGLAKVGIGLHVVVGLALVGAGAFDMDAITIKPEMATQEGKLHGLTAMIGVPGQVLAALALAWGLTRSGQVFEGNAFVVLGLAIMTLVSLLSMFGYLAYAVPAHGGFGPNVWAGWLNRLVVLTFVLWIGVMSVLVRSLPASS